MASTKIRTGRRHLLRVSLRNTAAARPSGSETQRQTDLLDRAHDGVGTAAGGGSAWSG